MKRPLLPITISLAVSWLPAPARGEAFFRRGDANGDDQVDISDAAFTLQYLFLGGEKPFCPKAADADDSGEVDLTDAIFTLTFLFLGGVVIPPPGPWAEGPDPTPDGLDCPGGERALGGTYDFVGLQAEIAGDPPFYGLSSISERFDLVPSSPAGGMVAGDPGCDEMRAAGPCPFTVEAKKYLVPETFDGGRYELSADGRIVVRRPSGKSDEGAVSADGWIGGFVIDYSVEPGAVDEGRGFALFVKRPDLIGGDPAAFLQGDYAFIDHQVMLAPGEIMIVGGAGTLSFDGVGSYHGTGTYRTVSADPCDLKAPFRPDVHDGPFEAGYQVTPQGELTITADGETAHGFASADGEFVTFQADFDGPDFTPSRGALVAVRRGSRLTAADLRGAYEFYGMETKLCGSGEMHAASLSATLFFDGKGGLSGSSEKRRVRWKGFSDPIAVGSSAGFWDGGTYAVSPDGALSLRKADDGSVLEGFAAASGQRIILSVDLDDETNGDHERGLLLGFRRPSTPPAPGSLVATYDAGDRDDVSVVGLAVPGATAAGDYRLFRSFDGTTFEEEEIDPRSFDRIDGAFHIATVADRDTWYRVKAVVDGHGSAFSNTVFVDHDVRGPLAGLTLVSPPADGCVDSTTPEIAWNYQGPATIGSCLITVSRFDGGDYWMHAIVVVEGASWTYGGPAKTRYVLRDLEPGSCCRVTIHAFGPDGAYLGSVDPRRSRFRIAPCPDSCP